MKSDPQEVSTLYFEVRQNNRSFFVTRLHAGILTRVSYAAVRGQTEEEGAIQRILNSRRIEGIKEFILRGGEFPNAMILNWISAVNPLNSDGKILSFTVAERSAQIIDGQHRIAGLREAIAENPALATLELPVAIYHSLSTQECADIFLSINTEQKPVDRSLVYDLYGVASKEIVDPAAERARDIANYLNEDKDSPYYNEIKFPGSSRRRGGIPLSSAVSALKPLVEEKGDFKRIEVVELERQRQIIFSLFKTLQNLYGDHWWDKTNAFLYAAGFAAAIDFFKLRLMNYCQSKRSYTVKTMSEALRIPAGKLIRQEIVKGLAGKDAVHTIFEQLDELYSPKTEKLDLEID